MGGIVCERPFAAPSWLVDAGGFAGQPSQGSGGCPGGLVKVPRRPQADSPVATTATKRVVRSHWETA